MINALIIVSVLGFILGLVGLLVGGYALIKVVAMEKSTHKIQWVPANGISGEEVMEELKLTEEDEEYRL